MACVPLALRTSFIEYVPECPYVVSRVAVPFALHPGTDHPVAVAPEPSSKPGLARLYGEPVTAASSPLARCSQSSASTSPTRPKPCHCWSEAVSTAESAFQAR